MKVPNFAIGVVYATGNIVRSLRRIPARVRCLVSARGGSSIDRTIVEATHLSPTHLTA